MSLLADTGQAPAAAGLSDWNAIQFVIRQALGKVGTMMLVQVKHVDPSVPSVDIHPLVTQIDGAGVSVPHGVILNVPYFRLQGGSSAVIIDPVVGDIGFAVVSSRDISSVKATKAEAPPGSRRRFDLADSVYIGGILNAVPTQYVKMDGSGITITSPTGVTINAPAVAVVSSSLTHNGVNIGATHVHGGVQAGGSNTAVPH